MAAEPLVYTVEQTAELLAIGRGAAYEAVRRGDIPSVRLGRSLRVPRHALDELLGTPAREEVATEQTAVDHP
jgi:excisionase family DNA binding protein